MSVPPPPFHVVVRCRDITAKERQSAAHRFPYRRDVAYRCAMAPHATHEANSFVTIFDPDSTATLTTPTLVSHMQEGERRFHFSDVCGPATTNETVYNTAVKPLVNAAWDGYHSTCFAYGVTGSGKSYTMMGEPPQHEGDEHRVLGMCHFAIQELFERVAIEAATEQREAKRQPPRITAQYVELYNEEIRDLLDPNSAVQQNAHNMLSTFGRSSTAKVNLVRGGTATTSAAGGAAAKIDIVEDPSGGTILRNALSLPVNSVAALEVMLEQGTLRRTKASTTNNECSSRSHAVLLLTIQRQCTEAELQHREPHHRAAASKDSNNLFDITSRFSLVDLAGSERAHAVHHHSGAVEGLLEDPTAHFSKIAADRRREGATINKSLLALGNCITALGQQFQSAGGSRSSSASTSSAPSSSTPPPFVPYRDSKLTRLLRDSLGGNTRTVMIATISPSCLSYEETLATLKYATRAKAISRHVTPNVTSASRVAAAATAAGSLVVPPPQHLIPVHDDGRRSFSIPPPLNTCEPNGPSWTQRHQDHHDANIGESRHFLTNAPHIRQDSRGHQIRGDDHDDDEQQMSLLHEWETKVVAARTQLRIAERTADKLLIPTNTSLSSMSEVSKSRTMPNPMLQREIDDSPHCGTNDHQPPQTQRQRAAMPVTFVDPYANPTLPAHTKKSRAVPAAAAAAAAAATADRVVECAAEQLEENKAAKLQQFYELQAQLVALVKAKQQNSSVPTLTSTSTCPRPEQPTRSVTFCNPQSQSTTHPPPPSVRPPTTVSAGVSALTPMSPNRTYTVGKHRGGAAASPVTQKQKQLTSSVPHHGNASHHSYPHGVLDSAGASPTSIVDVIRRHWHAEKSSAAASTIDAFLGLEAKRTPKATPAYEK